MRNMIDETLVEFGEDRISDNILCDFFAGLTEERGSAYEWSCAFLDETYEHVREMIHCDLLDWCGCGNPEEADRAILNYLESLSYYACTVCEGEYKERNIDQKHNTRSVFGVFNESLILCLMYAMDEKGLTEHGSSIYGAWLTTKGYAVRLCLRRYFDRQKEEK